MKRQIVIGIFFLIIIAPYVSAQQPIHDEGSTEIRNRFHERPLTIVDGKIKQPKATTAAGYCSDMGGESGWGSWQASTGIYQSYSWTASAIVLGAPGNGVINVSPTTVAPRFGITSPGIDPCTPGTGGPPLPLVAPGFGNSSIRIGEPCANGIVGGCSPIPSWPEGCAEQLVYPLQVTAQDTNFLYAYAIVLENPPLSAAHAPAWAPFASIFMLDQNNDTIPCSYHLYSGEVNGTPNPGFYPGLCAGSTNTGQGFPPNGMDVSYKPWTIVGINLKAYVGQTITVVITNADCTKGGHYCYSYWDFMCTSSTQMTTSYYCPGQQINISAPADSANPLPYTYTWYQNGHPYTGLPNNTAQTITPTPMPGDTFSVHVLEPSACGGFWMSYVPEPTTITPNFSVTPGTCSNMNFIDNSTVGPVSSGNTITSWNWHFPGGIPANSTSQNPGTIVYQPGTYTVTLVITSSSGCTDSVKHSFTVSGTPPVANFSALPVCAGNPTHFTDHSTGGPTSWNWNFGDGNTSTIQNPSNVYATTGTYTVTLIVSSGSCGADTLSIPVTVNPLAVSSFSNTIVCFNNPTVFTDLSTAGGSTISQWGWNFGDGNTSAQQNPSHTYNTSGNYTVSLIVTNNFGCTDTFSLPVLVSPLPMVNFSSSPVCLGTATCFSDLSSVTSGSITGWNWNFGEPSSTSNISNLQNPCHTYSASATYSVVLTVTSTNNCQSTTTLSVTVNPSPVAAFSNTSPCLGSTTNLINGSTSSVNNPITSYNWTMVGGNPASATSQNTTTIYNTAGTHTVILIVNTQSGCKDTIVQQVVVDALPVANFSGTATGCAPVCNQFIDLSTSTNGNIIAWNWDFPGGSPLSSTLQNPPVVCYDRPGNYGASLIVTTVNGCKDTIKITPLVHVYPLPHADFCVAPDKASIMDPTFNFCNLWTPNPGVTNWAWNFGDGSPLNTTSTHPVHSYSATTTDNDFYTYNVCLMVQNQYGCRDTTCKPVQVTPDFTFYIPNTFTPNDDNTNNLFYAKGSGIKDYTIWLFDRWGNLIWDCHQQGNNSSYDDGNAEGMPAACKWDGVYKGDVVQEDVYVWKVQLTDIFDMKHEYKGVVSVVK